MADISVVFPVYNNLESLRVTLPAILGQVLPDGLTHEVIVVDDGSTPAMRAWVAAQAGGVCRVVQQPQNTGRSRARNAGFRAATGAVVVFLDSDVTVPPDYLAHHAAALGLTPGARDLPDRISIGRVVDSYTLGLPPNPEAGKRIALPHFTTANVAIPRALLDRVCETPDGPFDAETFTRYGWEDLELEQRLVRLKPSRIGTGRAVGYHFCPPFTLDQMTRQIDKEVQRADMARAFLKKHPNIAVRLMIQKTPLHRALWLLLSLGGLLNARTMRPVIGWLIARDRGPLAEGVARITVFNPVYMRHL